MIFVKSFKSIQDSVKMRNGGFEGNSRFRSSEPPLGYTNFTSIVN